MSKKQAKSKGKKLSASKAGSGVDAAQKSSAYEAAFDPDVHIKLQKDAAKYAGVCVRVLRRWKNKRGMPVSKEGWYLKGMIDIWKSKDSGDEGAAMAEHRQRDTIAIAGMRETKEELLKLELAEKKGQSHNVAECRARNVEKVITIKRALLGQGRRLAPRLVNKSPAQIKKILDDDNKAMIRSFAGPS